MATNLRPPHTRPPTHALPCLFPSLCLSQNTIQLAYIGHLGTEYLTAGTVAMVVMFGIYGKEID